MENEDDYTATFCPSFSSYTGDRIAETAERVRLEFSDEHNDDFEFVNPRSYCEAASFSGDGDLVFPVFNRILIPKISAVKSDDDDKNEILRAAVVTTRLRDFILRDREDSQIQVCSSSSSDEEEEEEHELDRVSNVIDRPWTPEKSPNGGWRKSKSTGSSTSSTTTSSRRWRIRDLLKRSYSEGKQSLKFLNSNSTNREESSTKKKEKVSAHEKFYLKNKAKKEEEKRKSYLPYKQDLVGFLFNRKTIPSF
ncbi:unnamed protein product [Microthlaspi erraticum]|uniref:DUF1645 domain-containing protein n=1 Tax=Microthlaspi erraticum TaxID=1685480 RepID=A0A6D2L6T7_9BRAS|nr:unnamed protein product [Microthlaspi erraticum]